jgi:hypothetical protein
MDPALAVSGAGEAPRGIAKHYPADHFEVYHSPMVERLVADQIAFFGQHLDPGR